MPKKVKTKKQKILSDSRRKTHVAAISAAESITYSLPVKKEATDHPSPAKTPTNVVTHARPNVATSGYQYLVKDLRKTLLLTASIVIAQLLISYFIK